MLFKSKGSIWMSVLLTVLITACSGGAVRDARVETGLEPSDRSWNAPIIDEAGNVKTSISAFNKAKSRQQQTTLHMLSLSSVPSADCGLALSYLIITFDPLLFLASTPQREDYLITIGNTSEIVYGQRSTPLDKQEKDTQTAEYTLILNDDIREAIIRSSDRERILLSPVANPRDNYSFEWPTLGLSGRLKSVEAMCDALVRR